MITWVALMIIWVGEGPIGLMELHQKNGGDDLGLWDCGTLAGV